MVVCELFLLTLEVWVIGYFTLFLFKLDYRSELKQLPFLNPNGPQMFCAPCSKFINFLSY